LINVVVNLWILSFLYDYVVSIPRSLKEVEEYRARMKVTVKGNDIPYPIQYFEEGNFPTSVLDVIP
jgi:hypothetical protein